MPPLKKKKTDAKPTPEKKKPPSRYRATVDAVARATILSAMSEASGRRVDAAAALGLPVRTLYREIDRLNLRNEIDRLASEQNWPEWKGVDWGEQLRKPSAAKP